MISPPVTSPARECRMQNAECKSKGSRTVLGNGFARAARRAATYAFCLLHFALGFAYQPRDMSAAEVATHPDALRHYRENPARFIFKTPQDLPQGLKWETGENEPEFASPEAVRVA